MRILLLLLGLYFSVATHALHALPPTLAVEQIRPGMRGKTFTVMQGTEIVELDTEILGVQWGGADAGRHLIIGKLVDTRTALTQAVHGMSGSPLYVNGKLVGALSRRITIAEKDGHCAFTPIEDMLEIMRRPWITPPEPVAPSALSVRPFAFGGDPRAAASRLSRATSRATTATESTGTIGSGGGFSYLSLPWTVTGWNESWRPVWNKLFGDKLPMHAFPVAAGSPSHAGFQPPNASALLQPGSALAVALVDGDISVASTGTLTWREGDTFIGFGHPMMELGAVNLPIGPAEIVTVVPSYLMPYKLANAGPIVGTLKQDRLSAVSGNVGGKLPPMVPYTITRKHQEQTPQKFQGRFVTDRRIAPSVLATLITFAILDQQNISSNFWLKMRGKVEFDGLAPLEWNQASSGQADARYGLIYHLAGMLSDLYSEFGDQLRVQSMTLDLTSMEEEKVWKLIDLRVKKLEYKPKETVQVECVVENPKGEREMLHAECALPEELQSGTVTLSVMDASVLTTKEQEARKTEERSVNQAIDELNLAFNQEALYLQLSTSAKGVSVRGQEHAFLPQSVLEIMNGITPRPYLHELSQKTWLRTALNCKGIVSGDKSIQLEIIP